MRRKRLLHELQVHQLELEMQNAELRQARDEVETVLGNYTDLYDFAPVAILRTDLDTRAAERAAANIELKAFNYTVSHDLHRPLTVINGYCQVLRDLCRDQLDAQCLTYIQEMYDGALQMNHPWQCTMTLQTYRKERNREVHG